MIIGVDGEGYDAPNGRHIYIYLCAADETGKVVSEAYNRKGLSTAECIACLSKIPRKSLSFGFMFSYDVTKILKDLTTEQRYYLMRPDLRARGRGKKRWREKVCGWDYFAGSVSHARWNKEKNRWDRDFHIWDSFRFFGTSFVKALELWQIGTASEREAIAAMKGKRGALEKENIRDVKRYCQLECVLLARMMRNLIAAHEAAGIKLRRFDGAGSTAAALLRREGVASYRGKHDKYPKDLQDAIMSAYFGGHFENSCIGVVHEPCVSRDINSAYPHAMRLLPCLMCGKWKRTKSLAVVERSRLALCRLSVRSMSRLERRRVAWMPLPCRREDGSIVYGSGFSGWYHRAEALEALRGWSDYVSFHEAWVYNTGCEHDPFAWIPNVYTQRLQWGADGPGLVLKSGLNAGYGKLAQRIGGNEAQFRDWVWAGAITAETRALMLGQLNPRAWNVLAIATDGYLAIDDGTRIGSPGKPLGAWEEKLLAEGVVLVKPGLYWRRDADESAMRARGIGRRELYKHRKIIVDALERGESKVQVTSRRFYGAKSSAYALSYCATCDRHFPGVEYCPECLDWANETEFRELTDDAGKPVCGQWAERTIDVDFGTAPKREAVMRGGRLRVPDLGGVRSEPYRGETTPEGREAHESKELALEQHDWED